MSALTASTTPSQSHLGLAPSPDQSVGHERIASLALELGNQMRDAIAQIEQLNSESRCLSFNAQIEAQRTGSSGNAFGIVALEIRELSSATARIAKTVNATTQGTINEMQRVSELLSTNVRGTRLSDLALMNIDLIDRNLYERSCDCRWWATDSSLVNALEQPTAETLNYASRRMATILKSYTVYYDLVLADASGKIVANGRTDLYRPVGQNCQDAEWFQSAMRTVNGDQFGFQGVHASSLVQNQRVLIYSAGVRAGGESDGELLGVLGIVFNWDALAQTIVQNTSLEADERKKTRVLICDSRGKVLADTAGRMLREELKFPERHALFTGKKNFANVQLDGRTYCAAHAQSPGFETYKTGWHSLILQEIDPIPSPDSL